MKIENRIYSRREVEEMTGLSKSSLYRLMYAGDFPQTVQLSPPACRMVRIRATRLALRARGTLTGE